jgi:phosphoribosylformylglycinamidine cyclo-ligase
MEQAEVLKTFNAGIGMVLAVDPAQANAVRQVLEKAGETVFQIGRAQVGEGVSYLGSLS